jgi:molybdate transport repressor ModE-like protein
MDVSLTLNWSLGPEQKRLDPTVIALLDCIAEGGSLRFAVSRCGVSYRHAWGLLREWERFLGQPLVRLDRGRGALLTTQGERLLRLIHREEARLRPALDRVTARAGGDLREIFRPGGTALRIAASHSLALGLLREQLARDRGVAVDLHVFGSLPSLRRYRDRACDAAGFHLPLGEIGRRLAPQFQTLLDPGADVLIEVVTRVQGLIVAPGKRIGGLADLGTGTFRFINRQPGSGSRLILDALLEEHGVDPGAIPGYADEEYTHLAVAAIVAAGEADVGFGVQAAAHRFRLGFIPLLRERYYLAAERSRLDSAPLAELMAVLRSESCRGAMAGLVGNDATGAGTLRLVADLSSGE